VTVTIYDAAGTVIAALTGEAATAVGSGIYQYVLAGGYVTERGHYRAIFSTTYTPAAYVGEDITFTFFFTYDDDGQSKGLAGLTPTVVVDRPVGVDISGTASGTGLQAGLYQYTLSLANVTDPGKYRAVATAAGTGSDTAEVAELPAEIEVVETTAEVEVAEILDDVYCTGGSTTTVLSDNALSGIVRFPYPMTTVNKVLVGAFPVGQTLTIFTGAALEIMHGGIPPALVNDTSISFLPGGFTYLLADGAAVLALTGDLRYNESTNSQTAPLIQQFWQGVGQLEALMDTMQRDRVQQMEVVSPHSPYA
jgi:hypothetical protein